MRKATLFVAVVAAFFLLSPVGASATINSSDTLQSMPTVQGAALECQLEMSDIEMGNCVACDAGKSKGVCAGKSSCNGSASDCRKKGCRVKGTTSKCSNSC